MKAGFLINPLAGIGGSVALKGSDGQSVVEAALARGAQLHAGDRALQALQVVDNLAQCEIITAAGAMGSDTLGMLGAAHSVVYEPLVDDCGHTTAADSRTAVRRFVDDDVDIIIFAGGDGTARDLLDSFDDARGKHIPVIGIPAGVKIHSAVYAVSPHEAGELLKRIIDGYPLSLRDAEVMDLDEDAFRDGRVVARCYGYMKVPVDDKRMQVTKEGGSSHHELAVSDIAQEVVDSMQDDTLYLVGSGTTTAEIMQLLELDNTLLGVDIVRGGRLLASDVDEKTIIEMLGEAGSAVQMIVTVIGGQGHVFGRGNQQLSPAVIRRVGRDNIIIVATNEKLRSLNNRPMIADTGDITLDRELAGLYPVITGYQQQTLYRLNQT